MDSNSMNAAGMPDTSNQPVDSAQPAGPQTVEQALAEANMEVASGVPMGAPVKKSGKGMLYGMIIFAILAIAGIGFGVYMVMDGNTQKTNYEKQISDLKAQNNQLLDQIAENDADADSNYVFGGNPVIKSSVVTKKYSIDFRSSEIFGRGLSIGVENGAISSCSTSKREIMNDLGGYTLSDVQECTITGLDGEIYYVGEFGAGHDASGDIIGFVMTDGTVKYLLLDDAINKSDFSISGKLNIDGYVVNAVGIGVSNTESIGGYGATVFVLSDGTFVEFDHSLLE